MNFNEEWKKLQAQQHEAAFMCALAVSDAEREGMRLRLEAGDIAGARDIAINGKSSLRDIPWTNASTDAMASDLINHILQYASLRSLSDETVIGALLLALARYIGPFQFAALLQRLTQATPEV